MIECRQCKQIDTVPNVVAYFVSLPKPQDVWLHPGCAKMWFEKYRSWLDENSDEKKRR